MADDGPCAVRVATPADRTAVLALLVHQLRDHGIGTPEAAMAPAVGRLLHDPEVGLILVATVDDDPVGVAALSFVSPIEHGGRSAWLEELYVLPEHRERGIGRTLLRAALGAAETAGAVAVDLEVDAGHARAAHLYAREGFRRLERVRWVRRLVPGDDPGA
jgi:GNAT superfamily N-acetyltransferase